MATLKGRPACTGAHDWHNDGGFDVAKCRNCPARSTFKKLDQLARMRATAKTGRAIRKRVAETEAR